MQQNFWVLVLEAKKTTLSTRSALPQALADMMANTQPEQPTFGMMTNDDDVLFVKLTTQPEKRYSLSRAFSLYTVSEELQTVLKILEADWSANRSGLKLNSAIFKGNRIL